MKYCRDCGAELTDEVHVCPARENEAISEQICEPAPKKKWSPLAIIGFCISFVAPAVLILLSYLGMEWIESTFGSLLEKTGLIALFLLVFEFFFVIVCSVYASGFVGFVALVISITGLILAIEKQKRGRGFAIAGIAMSSAYLMFIVINGFILVV